MPSFINKAFDSTPFAMTLLVDDLAATKVFYGDKLGLQKLFEDEVSVVYKCGQTVINLLQGDQASELLEPAKLAPASAGVRAVYTLRCAEIDQATDELIAAGVKLLNGPIDRPWGVRTVSFQDPSGHTWELANHA